MRNLLNKEQKKHVAGLIDKLSYAYFAGFGVYSYTNQDAVLLVHAVVMFAIMQWTAIWTLGDPASKRKD